MVAINAPLNELTLEIERRVEVAAPPEATFASILENIGPLHHTPAGPCPMTFEPWPGGRWFRDLGDGAGHLWAHVQVIKPPTLLELAGPLFMSYAAISHVRYRVEPAPNNASIIAFRHQAIGLIDPEHRAGVSMGWENILDRMRDHAQR